MRRTHQNILLVCEGNAEDALARVFRDIYLPRGCGVVLQRRNARGFGGARALDIAVQLKAEGAYHAYGVLIDGDAHWGDVERAFAQASGIHVIENRPCLEATLLLVGGHRPPNTTKQCKALFERVYGGPADREGVIARKFDRAQFDEARNSLAAIDQLLSFIQR